MRKRRIRGCLLDFCPEEGAGDNGIYGDGGVREREREYGINGSI